MEGGRGWRLEKLEMTISKDNAARGGSPRQSTIQENGRGGYDGGGGSEDIARDSPGGRRWRPEIQVQISEDRAGTQRGQSVTRGRK